MITFALRSTSLDARRGLAGSKLLMRRRESAGFSMPAVVADTGAGVFGGSVIDLTASGLRGQAIYRGFENFPATGPFSVLFRVKPNYSGTPAASVPFWGTVSGANNLGASTQLDHRSGTGNLTFFSRDLAGLANVNLTHAWAPVSGTVYDIMVTWDGTTGANAVKMSINGVEVATGTASSARPTGEDAIQENIIVGASGSFPAGLANIKVNELVVFDTQENHVYSARSDFYAADEFDGLLHTDPGVANVLEGKSYYFKGNLLEGEYHVAEYTDPGVENVLEGVGYTFDDAPKVGTLHIAQHTDPGVENVLEGVGYTFDDAPKVGTLHIAQHTDPGVENVLEGVQYYFNDILLTGEYPEAKGANTSSISYRDAKNKVLGDLDLLEESFIGYDELIDLFNDAIRDAAAEIRGLSLEEDYFLAKAFVDLKEGVNRYDLPADIYNRDIRRLIYHNGSTIYAVRRFRGKNKFEKIAESVQHGHGDDYRYYLEMDSTASKPQIVLSPASRETSSTIMYMHYIRNPRRIPLSTEATVEKIEKTEIDIPEFISFIYAFVKVKILEKAKEPLETYMHELQRQRQLMIDTLSGYADDDDEVIPDLRHYRESN